MEAQVKKYLSNPDHPMFLDCFVCGIKNPRGLNTKFFIVGDGVKATFTADETLSGYKHSVHGGIISSLLDEAIIWASYAATGRIGVTAELTVRFLKSLSIGKKCTIKGKVVKNRRRLWIAKGEIVDEEGKLCATAIGKVVPMHQEQMDKIKGRKVF